MGVLRSKKGSALLLVMVSVMVLAILITAGLTICTASLRAGLNREASIQAFYYASSINKAVAETMRASAWEGTETVEAVPLPDERYTCRVALNRSNANELRITVTVEYGDETEQVVSLLPYDGTTFGEPRYGGG